jgi:bifunctional DNase/RNase
MAEEQVVMLKHRLFRKSLPKTFDLLDRAFDDLDEKLREKVIDKDIRTMITSRRHKVIGQLKLDMMAIYISTAEATARGHAKIAKEEEEKLLSLKNNVVTTNDIDTFMINNVMNAIEARQGTIIKRAQYITGCKVSFFDETPTLLMK